MSEVTFRVERIIVYDRVAPRLAKALEECLAQLDDIEAWLQVEHCIVSTSFESLRKRVDKICAGET